jgi:diketogulonate reductase-like aldo/keto reductase
VAWNDIYHLAFFDQRAAVMDAKMVDINKLNRREFHGLCATFGRSLTAVGMFTTLPDASAFDGATAVISKDARTVKFRDGTIVPALGQGSMRLGQEAHAEALRTGISLGMALIDTAELYGNEEFVGRVIANQRDHVFLVSKVLPKNAAGDGIAQACEASLGRLKVQYLDLYLLHWRETATDLPSVVAAFERLRTTGKIRAWGVSNFSVHDMDELFRIPRGDRCATNQVRYNLGDRSIERDLLPWCERHGLPLMAYSPLGGGGSGLLRDPTLARLAAARGYSAAAIALAWAIRSGNVIAIPESGSVTHVKENAIALSLILTPQELQTLNAAYPPPDH